jgi:protein-S-isoprenylcysteine O-methyltransferase Ste14
VTALTLPASLLLGALGLRVAREVLLVRRSLVRHDGKGRGTLLVFGLSWVVAASQALSVATKAESVTAVMVLGILAMLGFHHMRVRIATRQLGAGYDTGIVPQGGLVTHGAYAWIRHPVYLFYALELAALAIGFPTWMGALAFMANLIATLVRIPAEERHLARVFGTDWNAFASTVRWRLIPRIW